MNVTAPAYPTAMPPIQMKTKKKNAQRKAVTPGAKAGRRKCIAERSYPRGATTGPDQKFTEPVALSSTSPGNLRLPPTALGSGFDLLALRARCKREPRARVSGAQGSERCPSRNLRELLQAYGEIAIAAVDYKGVGTRNSPSRWRFRPPPPGTFGFRLPPSGAASTYSRSVLGARGNVPTR